MNRYDSQFRIRDAVPDFDAFIKRYKDLSAATRRSVRSRLDVSYGESALERLDVFLPSPAPRSAPVHIFFHGGYWRSFDKADYSYIARPIVEAGAIAIIANYGLMPATSMAALLSQCCAVVRWAHDNAERLGGSARRISLSGHSAGSHIASWLHLAHWHEHGLPRDLVKTTIAVSGIYDLAPVLNSFLLKETGLTEREAAQFSPMSWVKRHDSSIAPLFLCCGADETDEFRRQSTNFAAALRAQGAQVELRSFDRRHHMNIVLDLGDANSELGGILIERIMASRTSAGQRVLGRV